MIYEGEIIQILNAFIKLDTLLFQKSKSSVFTYVSKFLLHPFRTIQESKLHILRADLWTLKISFIFKAVWSLHWTRHYYIHNEDSPNIR